MSVKSKISIRFLGAAGTVTGSKFLISACGKQVLIDCGMFQGLKELRLQNWDKLPVDVSKIDVVLLTHGHLDHTGYLPRLVKDGFKGKIRATAPTLEIARIILQDSARIQEEDAERANAEKFSRHSPALPLYTTEDVGYTLPLFEAVPLDEWIQLGDKLSVRFSYNGHILGACFIELKAGNKLLVFSGDIGRENDPLMFPPQKPEHADILLIESTYGNRLHPPAPEQELERLINESVSKQGTIIIPSFAVERTQMLMYMLWKLRDQKKIPPLPVYMDSPMGNNVLQIFHQFPEWHKLSESDCTAMCKDIQLIDTMKETLKLAADKRPKIVIAGSGMASGGRVLTYFQFYLEDPSATILLAGYQAEGTRGRKLLNGDKELKVFGKLLEVKATIGNMEGLSAHADQAELLRWLNKLDKAPEEIYIVHGEKEGAEGLRDKIKEVYGWNCGIPKPNDYAEIANF
ncbi:MAG TPA: MBL fold metallo-hydrolase [Bacteroidia bacterium]|jgi:metallo-beta-lactamase family protein|nr:MBL fold metallo-hydrolase [Bacteroidia bacterium]